MVMYSSEGDVVNFMNDGEVTSKQTLRVRVRCYAGAPYGIAKQTCLLEPGQNGRRWGEAISEAVRMRALRNYYYSPRFVTRRVFKHSRWCTVPKQVTSKCKYQIRYAIPTATGGAHAHTPICPASSSPSCSASVAASAPCAHPAAPRRSRPARCPRATAPPPPPRPRLSTPGAAPQTPGTRCAS